MPGLRRYLGLPVNGRELIECVPVWEQPVRLWMTSPPGPPQHLSAKLQTVLARDGLTGRWRIALTTYRTAL